MVGLRTALSVALILMVISEMIGQHERPRVPGPRARSAASTSAGTFAGVIVIGVVGLVVNLGFVAVEGRIMRWYRGARGLLDDTTTRRSRRQAAAIADAPVAVVRPARTEEIVR